MSGKTEAAGPLAATFEPPYYAVIFSNVHGADTEGYDRMADRMLELAARQPGYLGVESVRDESGTGITISYWKDLDAISRWKAHSEHKEAQKEGRARWYAQYRLRICRVEKESAFPSPTP